MNSLIRSVVVVTVVFVVLALLSPSASAKNDKSKGKGSSAQSSSHSSSKTDSSTPPGWSKGQKTGWGDGQYPPGWSKWDDGRKNKWKTDRSTALDEIDSVSRKYHMDDAMRSQIRQGFDEAIAGGLMIDDARKRLVAGLSDSKQRKEFMVDTAQSVLEYLK